MFDADCASLHLNSTNVNDTSDIYCDLQTRSAVCAMWIPVAAQLNLTVPYGSGVDLQLAGIASRRTTRTDLSLLSSTDTTLETAPERPLVFSDDPPDAFSLARIDGAVRLGGPATETVPAPHDAALSGT